MRLPREILVGPHLYRVRSGQNAERHLTAEGGLMGQCDTRTSTIYVAPSQSDSQQADTLLHGLLHAAYDITPLRAGAGNGPNADEEAVVSALAPILLTMLRANPKLVDVLAGRA